MFLQNSLFLFSDHAPVPWWSWCKSKKIRVRQCLSRLVSQKQGVCLLVINKIYRRFTIITRPAPPRDLTGQIPTLVVASTILLNLSNIPVILQSAHWLWSTSPTAMPAR